MINKDDAELFGKIKKGSKFPKNFFVMKLVRIGFAPEKIPKTLSKFLENKCKSYGMYTIPECSKYAFIWASSKVVTKSTAKDYIKIELKKIREAVNTYNNLITDEEIKDAVCEGQYVCIHHTKPYIFFLTYFFATVDDEHHKKYKNVKSIDDFMEACFWALPKVNDTKWVDGAPYEYLLNFISKRLPKLKLIALRFRLDIP